MSINQNEIINLFKNIPPNIQTLHLTKNYSKGATLQFRIGSRTQTGIFLQDTASGDAIAFQTEQGNWYIQGNSANLENRQDKRIITYNIIDPPPQEKPIVFSVQILYFVWDAGYFNWYVGGDRKVPLLIKREADDNTFPPTKINSDRGVNYTEYELSNHSNLDKGKFQAIINTNYAERYGSNPITPLGVFYFIDAYDPILGKVVHTWVPLDPNPVDYTTVRADDKIYYRKQYVISQSQNSFAQYDLVHQKRYETIKGLRYLGNGYAFGSINLLRRYYQGISPEPGVFNYYRYNESPYKYQCYLSYLQPIPATITPPNDVTSHEVIVDVTFSKDNYTYSLPVSEKDGEMPTLSPITTYNGNLNTYSYEGEHYLMIGKNSYITEYIKKTSPTNIVREIRFYKNKTFVSKLNTNTAFTISNNNYGNGGFSLDYKYAIQLQRYKKDDKLTLTTYNKFQYLEFCQTLIGKTLTIASSHYKTHEFWEAKCIVNNVRSNQDGSTVFDLILTNEPSEVLYISLLSGIFGYYYRAPDGFLFLESGSFYDFAIGSTDLGTTADGKILDNNYLGAYNNTSEFHPFDPNKLDYLHQAILDNKVGYNIYRQDNLFGSNLKFSEYPAYKNNQRHLSNTLYLNNNFTKLEGDKIYRFQIIYDYTVGRLKGRKDTVAEGIQHSSSDPGYIRNVEGIDKRATCYIEVWSISGGNVTRQKKLLKVPVYGLKTEDINWIFSDILDIDIGIK